MEPQIYFIKESPDFNFFLERGRIERIAANRVIMCIMTEFGLYNDRRMGYHEFSKFIESIQIVSNKEQPKIAIKTTPLEFTSNICLGETIAKSAV